MPSPGQRAADAALIKREATRLGFDDCGLARADFLDDEARYLEQWLNRNAHGDMQFMERHFDKRVDPRELVPGAKTVLCVMKNYFTKEELPPDVPKISKYAYGEDYHRVLKERLHELLAFIQTQLGPGINGRAFVDSAPIMDKAWARRAGLGWMGKHTNILRRDGGSFFFLGELVLDAELPPDAPVTDHCGSCRRCIDACPTDALTPYEIDASRCIAHLTIELKDTMPDEFAGKLEGWAFGCDICQDVCPWNRFAEEHQEERFRPLDQLLQNRPADWAALSSSQFDKRLKNSPLSRIRKRKFLNNLHAVQGRFYDGFGEQPEDCPPCPSTDPPTGYDDNHHRPHPQSESDPD